jgi:protocatechuate 3,4-dioxygenase beta subunit
MRHTARAITRRANQLLWTRSLRASPKNAKLGVTRLEDRVTPDVTGTVFRDNNFDGQFLPSNDQGFFAGVTLTAFDSLGNTKSAATQVGGTFTIPTSGMTGPFRIEVSVPANFAPGPIGKDNPSTVRYLRDANATGVTFGIVNPYDYSGAAPDLFTARFSYGDSQGTGNDTRAALVSFPYTNNGLSVAPYAGVNGTTYTQQPVPTTLATVNQVGSVYGLVRQQSSNTIYAGAFVRRHVGLGPEGPGAIYAVDGSGSKTVNLLVNLDDLADAKYAGMIPAGSTAADFFAGTDTRLGVAGYDYNADSRAPALTHRIGLGDVDLSDDGRTLYTINLNTRELIEIPITATGALDTTRQFRRTPVPLTLLDEALNFNHNEDVRPFAISVKDGVVFVGSTFTAETSKVAADLRAYVYAFDTATGQFRGYDQTTNRFTATLAPALTANLSYARINGTDAGTSIYNVLDPSTPPGTYDTGNAADRDRVDTFRPWDNVIPGDSFLRRQQPLVSDIEFDRDVMVLGVRDRFGDLIGWNVPGQANGAGEGDLLRAGPTGTGGFLLESGGVSNGVTNSVGGVGGGAATFNPQGPGGGRFYWSNYLWGSDGTNNYGFGHGFLSMGGLYQVPGGARLATTMIDPIRYSSTGVGWFDHATGARPRGFELYSDNAGELGKANGVGDLEAFEAPAPVEVGNRIWLDADADGIQDPGEAPIAGVDVQLINFATNQTVATVTTDGNGHYLFSGFTGPTSASAAYGLTIGTNTKYVLRVPNVTGAGQQGTLATLKLTTPLADPSANGGLRDSNFVAAGTHADAVFVTGGPGAIDHSFDAGFQIAPATVDLGNLVFVDVNNDGIFGGTDFGLKDVVVTVTKDVNGNGLIDAGDTTVGTKTTDANGAYLFPALPTGTYIVSIAAPAGYFTSTGTNGNAAGGAYEPGKTGTEDSQDHGTLVNGVIQTKSVELFDTGNPDGTQNLRQDFGLFRPYSLGNRVWLDANNSGTIDGAEGGIDGVTVRLIEDVNGDSVFDAASETVLTAVTAGGGYYRFDFLRPSKYVVQIDGGSLPLAGLRSSTGSVQLSGPYEPTLLSFGDSDDNGTAVGVHFRSAVVVLGNAAGGDTEVTTETDAGPGDPGAPNPRSNLSVDFGFFRPLALGNRVFLDANNNGVFDAGDANGPANVGLALLDAAGNPVFDGGGTPRTTVTDANGYYLFSGLNPGPYRVEVSKANFSGPGTLVGFMSSTGGGNGATAGPNEPVGGLPGDDKDAGTVNGTLPTGGVRSNVVTLVNGAAAKNEPRAPGSADPTADGDSELTLDFGFYRPLTLGNYVWDDANNDGLVTVGESGLANVPVGVIFDANGNGLPDDAVLRTTTTNAQGYYQFTGLFEGTYFVTVTPPAGYVSSTGTKGSSSGAYEPAAGPNDNKDHFDDGTSVGGGVVRSGPVTLSFGGEPTTEPASPGFTDPATNANGNLTVDFGLFRPLSIGNRVWDDLNNNGQRELTESGVAGVTVTLFDAVTKTSVMTTTTDANGHYLFPYLVAGSYYVEVIPPPGFVSSTGGVNGSGVFEPAPTGSPDNNLDDRDDGTRISATVVRSGPLSLAVGGEPSFEGDVGPQSAGDPAADAGSNLTVDFGIFRPLSLGNLVFFDKNNSGLFDPGSEAGLANVSVNLWTDPDGDGVPNVKLVGTTTNASGSYLLTGLGQGTYVVQVDQSTLPAGYWRSSSGQNGSLTGPNEPAAGPGNKADQGDDGTARDGLMVLSGPVTLTVGAAPTLEGATPGMADPARDQDSDVTVDFGFYQPVSIGNRVFFDANNDGTFDPITEAGLANVAVRLIFDANGNGLADDAVLLSTTTNADGGYRFTNLNPGPYFVEVTAPDGYLSSTGQNGNDFGGPFEPAPAAAANKDLRDHGTAAGGPVIRSGPVSLTVGGSPVGEPGVTGLPADPVPDASANASIDFGLWRPLALGNLVFFDKNNNGVFDSATESGLPNVPVRLYDAQNALVSNTTTGPNGQYLFTSLGAGSYRVEIDAPAGFVSSSGQDGRFAGPFEPAPNDDADGTDNGTATTPGGRLVRSGVVVLAAGAEPAGEDGDPDTDLTIDFGLVRGLSLGNLVWDDANNNGTVDPGESGVAGVAVRLYADVDLDGVPDGGVTAQTTTDANGRYRFDGLLPGGYLVEVADPVGYVPASGKNGVVVGPYQPAPSPENDTDDDDNGSLVTGTPGVVRSDTVVLATGTEPDESGLANLTVDFGYFRPMSIGDRVWNDKNNNGTIDAGEPGLANVPLRLFDGAGVQIGSTKTNGTGHYRFPNLVPGSYTVEADLPAGLTSATGGAGGTGGFEPAPSPENDTDDDDNGTATTGQTVRSAPVTLARGTEPNGAAKNENLTIDFAAFAPLAIGNRVWLDANNNGTLDAAETGIAGVIVRLYRDADSDGVPEGPALATQVTNASGHYLFTGLGEGNFVVEVDPPPGYFSSSGTNASLAGPAEPSLVSNGSRDGLDNGTTVAGVVRSDTVTLTIGGEPIGETPSAGLTDPVVSANANLTVDFGFVRPMAIGNRVFDDRNNDGRHGATEPGVPDVVVRLLDSADTVVATTKTDSTGTYRFDNLTPGSYVVEIQPPVGYGSSTGGANGTGPFEPAPNPTGTTNGVDVGTTRPDGTVRSGPVTLTLNAGPVADGDTDPNTDLSIDFGVFRPLSLGNLVWNDENNDGAFGPGEAGLGAVTVTLWGDPEGDGVPNTPIAGTVTNAAGSYLFTGVGEGTYVVRVDPATLPAGFITSSGTNGSASGPYEPAFGAGNGTDNDDNGTRGATSVSSGPVTLALGDAPTGEPATPGLADVTPDENANATVDFGFYRPLSLGNLVWADLNDDGTVTTGEPGLPNLVVTLFDAAGTTIATTKTDANGNYRFDALNPNDYFVAVTAPAGVQSSKGAGNAFEPGPDPNDDADHDDNGTGPGATVRTGVVSLTAGGEPSEGGFANLTLDIGLLATAKVSGFVYRDPDVSGTYARTPGGDSPYPGVTVTISGTDAGGNPVAPRATTTDPDGFYQFTDLPPGTYTIVETQPHGIDYDGFDTPGSLNGTSPSDDSLTVTLAPLEDGQNYNFGEVPPANAFGYVYVDRNRNGRPDPGERPIAGVDVTISGTAYAGTPLARPLLPSDLPGGSLTATTNGAGRWEFPILPPGTYAFAETQPPGFVDALEQNGDPQTAPVITNDQFGGVVLRPFPVGGPYNFGEIDPADTGAVATAFVPDGNRPVVGLPFGPSFAATTGVPLVPSLVAVGAGPGFSPLLRVFDFATGGEKFRQFAYESSFTGGVRVATGDVNGDGIEDVVTSTGVGGGPRVRVFSGVDGRVLSDQFVYESTFRGGVFVAAGDVNGDGRADVIAGAEVGGGPRVRALDGVTGTELMNFFAFDANQRGGVRVAAADFNTDGRDDIVATTGAGVTTRVRVIDAVTGATLADFAPYEAAYTGGVYVAAGDVTGDGVPDIVVGADVGGGPRVQIFTGTNYSPVSNFFAYETTFTGGVRVATADVNGDARAEVVLVAGPGGAARTRVLRGADLVSLEDFYAFDVQYTGGAYVG